MLTKSKIFDPINYRFKEIKSNQYRKDSNNGLYQFYLLVWENNSWSLYLTNCTLKRVNDFSFKNKSNVIFRGFHSKDDDLMEKLLRGFNVI